MKTGIKDILQEPLTRLLAAAALSLGALLMAGAPAAMQGWIGDNVTEPLTDTLATAEAAVTNEAISDVGLEPDVTTAMMTMVVNDVGVQPAVMPETAWTSFDGSPAPPLITAENTTAFDASAVTAAVDDVGTRVPIVTETYQTVAPDPGGGVFAVVMNPINDGVGWLQAAIVANAGFFAAGLVLAAAALLVHVTMNQDLVFNYGSNIGRAGAIGRFSGRSPDDRSLARFKRSRFGFGGRGGPNDAIALRGQIKEEDF